MCSVTSCQCVLSREVQAGAHTLWIDNFSKNRRWDIPDLMKGVFHQGLWTGFAVRRGPRDLTMALITGDDGTVIPAMPEKPLDRVDTLRRYLLKQWFKDEKSELWYDRSLGVKWRTHNVPLRPRTENVDSKYRKRLDRRADSLENLHPWKVEDINVGENMGFARVMRTLYDEHNREEAVAGPVGTEDTAIVMDVDLFDKAVKVTHAIQ